MLRPKKIIPIVCHAFSSQNSFSFILLNFFFLFLGSYLNRSSSRSPSQLKDPGQEYQLSKDEFEFTKDYLNKEFRHYQQPNIDIADLYESRLSAAETERLKRSLFGEEVNVPTPDYLVKNSEFLQKSNEFLSRLARERSRKDGGRDAESRLLADYREILREYGDDVSVSVGGRFDEGAERLRREIERFRHEKGYSTSEDEAPRTNDDVKCYSKGVHRLLTGYSGKGVWVFVFFVLFSARGDFQRFFVIVLTRVMKIGRNVFCCVI